MEAKSTTKRTSATRAECFDNVTTWHNSSQLPKQPNRGRLVAGFEVTSLASLVQVVLLALELEGVQLVACLELRRLHKVSVVHPVVVVALHTVPPVPGGHSSVLHQPLREEALLHQD